MKFGECLPPYGPEYFAFPCSIKNYNFCTLLFVGVKLGLSVNESVEVFDKSTQFA